MSTTLGGPGKPVRRRLPGMARPDRRALAGQLVRRLASAGAGIGLAFAVAREFLRGSRDEDHGLVVESDGPDAWAG